MENDRRHAHHCTIPVEGLVPWVRLRRLSRLREDRTNQTGLNLFDPPLLRPRLPIVKDSLIAMAL